MKKYTLFEGTDYGGKADQLIALNENGFKVPYFRIIPAEFFDKVVNNSEPSNAIERINSYEFSQEELDSIMDQFPSTSKFVSVRSSAMGEDGKDHSFAGQFDTFLYVSKDELINKVKAVWKSVYSERIDFYRKQNNITSPLRMAVVIQEMIDSEKSGVMFGINPITQDPDDMLISSVYGIGEGLVSGELNADNFYIKNGEVEKEEIVAKTEMMVQASDKGGSHFVSVAQEKQEVRSLDTKELEELKEALVKLNAFYNFPQDVEWAISKDKLYILQSRPITNITIKKGTKIVWDNSNIIESYPGISSPLTFSFIRDMYEVVYRQFSELLGVSKKKVEANKDVFENMLGLLRGRVYYNLLGWYKALALLPGYHINARFMENMMGVKEKFDLEKEEQISKVSAWYRIVLTLFKMIKSFRRLPKHRDQFLSFLDKTIAEYKAIDFKSLHPEELMNHYKEFEHILTKKWNPPLVNDFFAMIYFGVFQKLVIKWIGEDNPHLHNDLLAHSNDIISVMPMRKSLEITAEILNIPDCKELFLAKTSQEVWTELETGKFIAIKEKIDSFLYKFGERCLGELKLETISYTQNPPSYIKILQSYVKNPSALDAMDNSGSEKMRNDAQALVKKKLKRKFFKRILFKYFMNKTRELVSNRENLRFERTRGFGIVREIFSAMGVQFQKRAYIDHDRDIFYLTKEEIFDFILGTSVIQDLKETITKRKKEYEKYEADEYVPERITTKGTVYDQLDFTKKVSEQIDGDISGIACCPGVVEAEVCVIHSPDEIDDLQGRIMVTSSTDPGWVSLFPTASAILVERGSLLSHSAIVARELGIPCIVGINNLLSQLKTGDVVMMDGSSGQVKIITHEKQ